MKRTPKQLASILFQEASQENHDGDPYDAMQEAGELLGTLSDKIDRLEKFKSESRISRWIRAWRDSKAHRRVSDADSPAIANSHIYLYHIRGSHIIYERSFPRDYPEGAIRRVEELRKRGVESFYVIGTTLGGTFY